MTDTIQYIHRHDVGIVFLNKEGKTYVEWYIGKGYKVFTPNDHVNIHGIRLMIARHNSYPSWSDRPIAVVRGKKVND